MTLACLERLEHTVWDGPMQVMLVDNGSGDGVAERVRAEHPSVEVRESAVNLGFAGGCNLGLRDLDGVDYVALVNNDVVVDAAWLVPLRAALEADPGRGAASPKMLLAERFVPIDLICSALHHRRGDPRRLGVRLSGASATGPEGPLLPLRLVEGFFGPERAKPPEDQYEWTGQRATFRVPMSAPGTHTCWLRLGADAAVGLDVVSGSAHTRLDVAAGVGWYEVGLGAEPAAVVNNAGTVVLANGYGADRGYLEEDHGQYDAPGDVFAWCGGAVLLRADYLRDVGIFDPRLFLYYEDLELAWRGRERSWSYAYVPASVVRHHHAATAVSGSAFAEHYKERNRLLVLTRHADWPTTGRAVVRYLLATASYARRDIVAPLRQGRRPHPGIVGRRLKAFAAFLRLAPAMVRDRRRGGRPGRPPNG
jgi:GT2 family glycosyltransferase